MLQIISYTIKASPATTRLKVGLADKTVQTKITDYQYAADKFTEGLGPTSRYLPLLTTDVCFADGFDLQQGCSINSLFNVIAEHINPSLHEFRNSVAIVFGLLNSQPLTVTPLTHECGMADLPNVASRKVDMMALLTLGDHCIVSQTTYASHCLLVRRLRK
jgi:hypothetical protein